MSEQLEVQIATMLDRLETVLAHSGSLSAEHRALLNEAQSLIESINAAVDRLQRSRSALI